MTEDFTRKFAWHKIPGSANHSAGTEIVSSGLFLSRCLILNRESTKKGGKGRGGQLLQQPGRRGRKQGDDNVCFHAGLEMKGRIRDTKKRRAFLLYMGKEKKNQGVTFCTTRAKWSGISVGGERLDEELQIIRRDKCLGRVIIKNPI